MFTKWQQYTNEWTGVKFAFSDWQILPSLVVAKDQIEKTYVVERTTKVRQYISNLCRSILCVETLTLYLTGPANSDGALMFWDRNQVGITDESKLYTPKQLLDDIRNCSARRVFLIADYSYSGAMISRLKSRISRHPDQFRNIMAISSTDWGEYAGRNNFTDVFIEKNKEGPMTKSVIQVFKVSRETVALSVTTNDLQLCKASSRFDVHNSRQWKQACFPVCNPWYERSFSRVVFPF